MTEQGQFVNLMRTIGEEVTDMTTTCYAMWNRGEMEAVSGTEARLMSVQTNSDTMEETCEYMTPCPKWQLSFNRLERGEPCDHTFSKIDY